MDCHLLFNPAFEPEAARPGRAVSRARRTHEGQVGSSRRGMWRGTDASGGPVRARAVPGAGAAVARRIQPADARSRAGAQHHRGAAIAGVREHLLRDLPQPAREGRRPGPRHAGSRRRRRTRRGVGEGGRQAARRPDAAGRHAAPGAGGDRRLRHLARGRPRPRRGRQAESGPHRAVSSVEPGRVSERDPGSARSRRGRHHVAADRRDQLRLRQHRRRPEAVTAADRAVSQRRAEGGAAGARHSGTAQRRPVPRPRSARSGRPPRGDAGGHARRHARGLPGLTRRRLRHQGPAEPRHRLRHPALHRRAAARDQRGRGAGQGLHRAGHARRSAQLRATGGPARPLASGPRWRSAQPREPARGGHGPQQPGRRLDRAGAAHGRRARDPRHVPDEDRRRVGGLPQAVPQAVHRPRHRRRTRDARGRGAARDGSHGAAQSRRRRHAAELPEGLRVPPGGAVRRDRLCPDGAVEAGPARVSPPGHRRRHRRADELLSRGPGRRHLRHRRRAGAAAHPHQPLVPLPHRVRARRVAAAPTASATSSWPRACRSSCGAASPTTSCWTWPRRTGSTSPP